MISHSGHAFFCFLFQTLLTTNNSDVQSVKLYILCHKLYHVVWHTGSVQRYFTFYYKLFPLTFDIVCRGSTWGRDLSSQQFLRRTQCFDVSLDLPSSLHSRFLEEFINKHHDATAIHSVIRSFQEVTSDVEDEFQSFVNKMSAIDDTWKFWGRKIVYHTLLYVS